MPMQVPLGHLCLALAVVAVWGSNFVVIKLGLGSLPPLLFATLRFGFAFVPAALFLKRPPVPLRELAAYGVLIGAGQIGLMYMAIGKDISPGLASLVVQSQVFFTIALSARAEREPLRAYHGVALVLASAGLLVIAMHIDATTTPLGLLLVLGAAFAWSLGNMVAKRAAGVNMLGYMVWSSAFAVPPLLLFSLVLEGPARMGAALSGAGAQTWAVVLWQSLGNTLFGYGAWAFLLARHAAANVVPLALLVPVFGMGASAFWLHEPLPPWKLCAATLVMAGLSVNMLWPRHLERRAQRACTRTRPS